MGVAVVIIGLGVRLAMVRAAEPPLSAVDLMRFEQTYGLDLPAWYEDSPFFLLWSRGDGQAFVALGSDLDLNGPARELAVPVYRFSRAGYAWLGRLAALGRPGWVPVGLMAVNALSLLAVGAISSVVVQRRGPISFILAANPALYIGFASDTAEPLGIALLMVALVASTGRRAGLAAGLLGAVRPSLATALPERGRNLGALIASFAAVALAVRFIGSAALGGDASIPNATFVIPLTGYFDVWQELPPGAAVVAGIPLVAALATIYFGLTKRSGWVRVSWVATGLLVLTFGSLVLHHPNNWIRAAAALPVVWGLSRPPDARVAGDQESAII